MNYNRVYDFGQHSVDALDETHPVLNAIQDAIKRRGLHAIRQYVAPAMREGEEQIGYIKFTIDRVGGSVDSCDPSVPHRGDFTIVTLLVYSKIGDLLMVAPGVSKRSIVDRQDSPLSAIYTAAFRAAKYVDDLLTFGFTSDEWSER